MTRRMVGMSRQDISDRERVFDNLIIKSLKLALRPVTAGTHDLITAAAPTISPLPAEPNPTIPAGALGIVTTTWSEQVDAELFPYLAQTFVDAAAEVFPEVAELAPSTPKITYDMATQLLAHAKNRLSGIGDVVWMAMREQLAQGYAAGESMPQLAARMRTVASISEPRALTIARTEVIPAINFGSLHQVIAAGFTDAECKKVWLATNDARTREAHEKADGQSVGLREPFSVGGDYLQVPGDPIGHPENIINCRCSVSYAFSDDDDDTEGPDNLDFEISEVLTADWTPADEKKHPRDKGTGKFKKKFAPDTVSLADSIGSAETGTVAVGKGSLSSIRITKTSAGYRKQKLIAGKWMNISGLMDESQAKSEISLSPDEWESPKSSGPDDTSVPASTSVPLNPVKMNTTTFLKNQYQDGAVVAERQTLDGLVRIRWDAGKKKFLYQEQQPAGHWKTTWQYNKSEAYKKFGGKVGWTESSTPSTLNVPAPSVPEPQPVQPAKAAKVLGVGVPIKLNTTTLLKTKYEHGAIVAEKPANDVVHYNRRLVWNGSTKKFVLEGEISPGNWIDVESFTKTGAYQHLGKEIGWQTPGSALVAPQKPLIAEDKNLVDYVKNLSQIEYEALDKDEKLSLYSEVLDTGDTEALEKINKLASTAISKKISNFPAVKDENAKVGPGFDVLSVYKMNHQEFQDWFGQNFVNDKPLFDSLGDEEKNFIEAKAAEASNAGHSGAFKTLEDWGEASTASLILAKSDSELVSWLATMTPAKFAGFNAKDLTKFEDKIPDLLNSGVLSHKEAVTYDEMIKNALGVLPVSGENIPNFDDDKTQDIVAWFNNLNQSQYDALSSSDKAIIANEADFFDSFSPPGQKTYSQKIADFGAGLGDAAQVDQSTSALPDFDSMNSGQVTFWMSNLTSGEYNSYSDEDKQKIDQAADNWEWILGEALTTDKIKQFKTHVPKIPPETGFFYDPKDKTGPLSTFPIYFDGEVVLYGKTSDTGVVGIFESAPFSPHGLNPLTTLFPGESIEDFVTTYKANSGKKKPSSSSVPTVDAGNITFTWDDFSGPAGSSPIYYQGFVVGYAKSKSDGSGAYIYDTSATHYLKNKIGEVDFDAGESVVLESAGWLASGKLSVNLDAHAKTGAVPTSPVPTPSVPTSTFSPDASVFHVDVHGKIKPASTVGTLTPSPPAHTFKVLSGSDAFAKQTDMLNAAGKTWSKANIAAIKRYGTSIGYRSTNAVLRDDKKQQKLLSEQQLKDGVKNAVDLQDAMTPILENTVFYRGTGAHAFGQNSIAADFTKLKALEGETITDKGFMSTTVIAKPSVGYDYAKKPLQLILKAPAGTPAVHVDSAIPGHGENEFVLAAGTSYRIDSVRVADAADKANYGNHVEHVVVATVVPNVSPNGVALSNTSGALPKSVPPAVTPTTPSAVPGVSVAPFVGPIDAADLKTPIKMNTVNLIKAKYAHGAVVGYRKNALTGSLYRLVWNETSKRFVLQIQSSGDFLNAVNLPKFQFTKQEAYKEFGGQSNWFAAPPGDTAIGSGGMFGPATMKPSISGGGTVAPVVTPPAPKAAKTPKFDAAQLQALHGTIPASITDSQKKSFYYKFKYPGKTTAPVTLNSTPAKVFKSIAAAVDEFNKHQSSSAAGEKLNYFQALKIVDEFSSKYSTTNTNAYENKIVAWLQTPSGKTTATKTIAPPSVSPSGAAVGISNAATVQQMLALVADPYTIGVPNSATTHFTELDAYSAQTLQNNMLANNPWTSSQKSALRTYTTSQYIPMNRLLRGKSTGNSADEDMKHARKNKFAQDGMRPLPYGVKVWRKTSPEIFPGLTQYSDFDDMKKFEGKLIGDKAFLSTSVDKNTWSGTVRYEIDLPEGTPAAFVKSVSDNPGEDEMLLAAGLRVRVISVTHEPGFRARVHLRVEA